MKNAQKIGIGISAVLIVIVVIFSLYFLMERGNDDDYVFFTAYFKTTTDIEENITVVIQKNDIDVFNQTLNSSKGSLIFNEEVEYGEYDVIVYWQNQTAKYSFSPQGYNSISISIVDGVINIQKATD